jgi:hypothetical protein
MVHGSVKPLSGRSSSWQRYKPRNTTTPIFSSQNVFRLLLTRTDSLESRMNFRPASADGFVACTLIFPTVFTGSKVPANGFLTRSTSGLGWECDRGYRKTQATCVAVKLPENAHLGFLGNDWECNKPYSKRMQACTSDNQND